LEEQLREALRKTGLSHHELARRSGVSQPVLSRFLNGQRSLTLPVAAKLCRALGLRLCSVDGDAGPVETPSAPRGRPRKADAGQAEPTPEKRKAKKK